MCDRESMDVEDESIPVVAASDGFKLLGTQLSLCNGTSKELEARMAAAWSKFYQLRPLLQLGQGDLSERSHFFDASHGSSNPKRNSISRVFRMRCFTA